MRSSGLRATGVDFNRRRSDALWGCDAGVGSRSNRRAGRVCLGHHRRTAAAGCRPFLVPPAAPRPDATGRHSVVRPFDQPDDLRCQRASVISEMLTSVFGAKGSRPRSESAAMSGCDGGLVLLRESRVIARLRSSNEASEICLLAIALGEAVSKGSPYWRPCRPGPRLEAVARRPLLGRGVEGSRHGGSWCSSECGEHDESKWGIGIGDVPVSANRSSRLSTGIRPPSPCTPTAAWRAKADLERICPPSVVSPSTC